jgi:hypothetical protein
MGLDMRTASHLALLLQGIIINPFFNQSVPLPSAELIIHYDKFKDLTSVLLTAMPIEEKELNFIALSVHTICYGEGTKKPITSGLSIVISCDEESCKEIGSQELILLVNDERLRMGKMETGRKEKYGNRIAQQLNLETGWLTLRRIARAQSVRGQIGNREFTLTASNLEWLRKFDSKIENKQSL